MNVDKNYLISLIREYINCEVGSTEYVKIKKFIDTKILSKGLK